MSVDPAEEKITRMTTDIVVVLVIIVKVHLDIITGIVMVIED